MVGPLHCSDDVTSISSMGELGNPGCHEGDQRNTCGKFKPPYGKIMMGFVPCYYSFGYLWGDLDLL